MLINLQITGISLNEAEIYTHLAFGDIEWQPAQGGHIQGSPRPGAVVDISLELGGRDLTPEDFEVLEIGRIDAEKLINGANNGS